MSAGARIKISLCCRCVQYQYGTMELGLGESVRCLATRRLRYRKVCYFSIVYVEARE